MSAARLDWYFDFVSPYSYLQFAAYPQLFRRNDVALKPVLFAGLLRHWGTKGPAEVPAKRVFTARHVLFRARELLVPLRHPPAFPINPLRALRLAVALGAGVEVVQTIFDFVWKEGRVPADEWDALLERLGVSGAEAEALVAERDAKRALQANGEAAVAAGVFGVPMFVAERDRDGPHLFWGLDATPMLIAWLDDPALFDEAEMRRIASLPSGAQRSA
ncbi:MAG: DsbA family protein [Burkholderiales bacterium]|nr:DsbA family protein [Burkholderiales bacterium]